MRGSLSPDDLDAQLERIREEQEAVEEKLERHRHRGSRAATSR
jgi:hypothetical protein